jgi:hypothetical protein
LENECSKNAQSGRINEPNTYRRIVELSKIRHENGDIFKNTLSKKGLE